MNSDWKLLQDIEINRILQKEKDYTAKTYEFLGTVIRVVEFKFKSSKLGESPFTGALVRQIPQEISYLIGNEILVSAQRTFYLYIDYPLMHPAIFDMTADRPLTSSDLLQSIFDAYANIYKTEAETSMVNVLPKGERLLDNRNDTNGKYGIWGHELGDLVVTGVNIYETADGKCTIFPHVES